MLQAEHSAILLTFIKLPFVIKNFVMSTCMYEWTFYTVFTLYNMCLLVDRVETFLLLVPGTATSMLLISENMTVINQIRVKI